MKYRVCAGVTIEERGQTYKAEFINEYEQREWDRKKAVKHALEQLSQYIQGVKI
jgi:nicotinamide mononucleotide (NMN) deamidase PncC